MPVYHPYKLAFIHIPKTAGTSVCHAIGATKDFFSYQKDRNREIFRYKNIFEKSFFYTRSNIKKYI